MPKWKKQFHYTRLCWIRCLEVVALAWFRGSMHVSLALVRNVQLLAVEPPHDVSMVRFIETALLKLLTRRLTTCSVIICSVIQKQWGVSTKAEKESFQSVEEITFVCAYTALNLSNHQNFPLPETTALVRALRAGSVSFCHRAEITVIGMLIFTWSQLSCKLTV